MTGPRWGLALVVAGALSVSACGAESGADPGLRVRDSAGIEIVENPEDGYGPASSWRVSAEPSLRLGSEDPGPELFTMIAGLVRLPDGGVALVESTALELRLFGPTGAHRRTAGGEGDGPGELRYARELVRLGPDTLAVYDLGERALELFTLDGDHIGRRTVGGRMLYPELDWGGGCFSNLPLLPDGRVLGCMVEPGVTRDPAEEPTNGVRRSGWRLAAARPDGSGVDTLAVYLGTESWLFHTAPGTFIGGTHPFLARSSITAGADPPRLYVATGGPYSVEVWTLDGTLERSIRREGARRAPTAEERQRADEELRDQADEWEPQVRALLPELELLPAVHGLATGPAGELWVKREPASELESGRGAVFDVFDGNGHYLGSVGLERNVELHEVGDDWLLTTWKDELDVPYVGVFELIRE